MKNKHIAFIMDGNRRFGKKHNQSECSAYQTGAKKISEILDYLKDKFEYISFWVLSKANNIRDLSALRSSVDEDEEMEYISRNFKCYFIGDIENLEIKFKEKIKKLEKINNEIKNFKNSSILSFFVNYSGSFEMECAMEKTIKNKEINLNFETIKKNSLTEFLPDINILIRTGERQRLSDFSFFFNDFFRNLFFKVIMARISNKRINGNSSKLSK